MKKINYIVLFFITFFLVQFSYSQFNNKANLNSVFVPDVMNKINYLENSFNSPKSITFSIDSLPLFPGWPLTFSGNVFEGSIVCNMDSDPDLEIVYNVGFTVQALNLDGTPVPGWPKTVSSYALEGSPAFGDIDGDGQGEIVVTNHGLTSGGFIYAYKKDGTPLANFPINHGYSSRTPVLADMNNDGKLDIIVNKRTYPTGSVYVYKFDGTILTGWPKSMGHVPASSPAVGDINGDNSPEIVMEAYNGLYAWKANGDSIPGFPFMMPNTDVNSYSSPVLADVDNDNIREIIFGTHVSGGGGYVYILKNDATVLSGWPKQTSQWVYGPPAVGYIDNDNILDIAVGDQVMSGSPTDYVYAWNKNGVALSGFPIGPLNAINNQIILCDIDNDNNTELIFDDNTSTAGIGKYLIYNHDGTYNSELYTSGSTMFVTPTVTDLNRNGILDITGGGVVINGSVYTATLALWNSGSLYIASKVQIPMWQYNARHNGVITDKDLVGIQEPVNAIVSNYELFQNYPNPFNPSTKISFNILKPGKLNLKIFNSLGKEVQSIVKDYSTAGTYEINFNGSELSSGIYFYKMEINNFSQTRKMLLLK